MLRVFGDPLQVGVHGMAEHRERNLWPTLKKRAAELSLERDHGVGQRGLGHPAASGCPREIALLAQRQEVADLLHLHGHLTRVIGLRYEVAPGPPLWKVRQFTQPRFSPAVGEGPDAPSACIERIARVFNLLRWGLKSHAMSMAIGYNRTDSRRVSVLRVGDRGARTFQPP